MSKDGSQYRFLPPELQEGMGLTIPAKTTKHRHF